MKCQVVPVSKLSVLFVVFGARNSLANLFHCSHFDKSTTSSSCGARNCHCHSLFRLNCAMPNASLTWNVVYVCRACGNSITIPFTQHFDDCTLADLGADGADGGTVAVAESPECEVIDEYITAPSCHNAVMDIADCDGECW